MTDPRSRIPGVDRLLEHEGAARLLARFPRPRVADALRAAVADVRDAVGRGDGPRDPADPLPYLRDAHSRLEAAATPSLRRVLNATGVVLHTNLGRAPLAPEARAAMDSASADYATLEFDLDSGRRGSRYRHCAPLLRELTGADDALVVNNCAAALVLAVNTLAAGRSVVVSRGELVEIGGGFRIPEMLGRAGAHMYEVGTTNRTSLADYRSALSSGREVGAILKVHRSNFRLAGFTAEAALPELVSLGRELGVPVIHDVGSGLLVDPAALGLPTEVRASASIAAGVDLAVFSGDKLLGGPQAGCLVGRARWVAEARANPLCRALRVDKATLAALEATLGLYRDREGVVDRLPVLRMLSADPATLESRARRLAERLESEFGGARVSVAATEGRVGGGTYPEHPLPSWAIRIVDDASGAEGLARRLRGGQPPVVGRIEDGAVLLDLRTVTPADDGLLVAALRRALEGG